MNKGDGIDMKVDLTSRMKINTWVPQLAEWKSVETEIVYSSSPSYVINPQIPV